MLDIASHLRSLITGSWSITYPSGSSTNFPSGSNLHTTIYSYGHGGSEVFDINAVSPQISFNDQIEVVYDYLCENTYRVIHGCLLTCFVAPIAYSTLGISSGSTMLLNMINEVNRILKLYATGSRLTSEVKLSVWKYTTDASAEPIIFKANNLVRVRYYE